VTQRELSRERRGPPRQLSEAELGLGVPGTAAEALRAKWPCPCAQRVSTMRLSRL